MKHGEGAADLLATQLAGLGETKKRAEKMRDEAKQLEGKVNENSKAIARLRCALYSRMDGWEKKNNYVESKVEELMTSKRLVKMSLIAKDFEEHLAAYIYPPHTPVTFGQIFPNLILWLHQNKNTIEGKEANNKWKKLQENTGIEWTDAHGMVLFKMYKYAMVITHQEIDASTSNNEVSFSDEEIQYCSEMAGTRS